MGGQWKDSRPCRKSSAGKVVAQREDGCPRRNDRDRAPSGSARSLIETGQLASQPVAGRPVVKLVFELLVLTATRSGEVRGAASKEIDREAGVCTVSAARTKGNREHR